MGGNLFRLYLISSLVCLDGTAESSLIQIPDRERERAREQATKREREISRNAHVDDESDYRRE